MNRRFLVVVMAVMLVGARVAIRAARGHRSEPRQTSWEQIVSEAHVAQAKGMVCTIDEKAHSTECRDPKFLSGTATEHRSDGSFTVRFAFSEENVKNIADLLRKQNQR